MRKISLRKGLMFGLLSLVSGCSFLDKVDPNSMKIGVGIRQVRGQNTLFKANNAKLRFKDKQDIQYYRLQINKSINDDFDIYFRGDFTNGEMNLSPNLIRGDVSGSFQSIGGGLTYKISEYFSLDFGPEIFYSKFRVNGSFGQIKSHYDDSLFGCGASIGGNLQIPLNDYSGVYLSGGYNLNENISKKADYDLSGFFGGMGFVFQIPK